MGWPRLAYLLLWFPEPSQTFILNEVNTLFQLGLDLTVYTLYGPRSAGAISGMAPVAVPVHRLGIASLRRLLPELIDLRRSWGPSAETFLAKVLARRWRCLETAGEALWAGLVGVHLARRFLDDNVDHIHAPWADGPATAAWVASHLSGIPFSFCARARDIYPPDGALMEKLSAAVMVRTNNRANLRYLANLAPSAAAKIVNIYNGVSLAPDSLTSRPPLPSGRLLAVGRLVPKKGFLILLESCRQLAAQGINFHLTLAGDGPQRSQILNLIRNYRLGTQVSLPGFVPHGQVYQLIQRADLLIMPSVIAPSGDRDGIPNVILEALSEEVPVVATTVCGIPEVIFPGETGWLVPPKNPSALTQSIIEALTNPVEARRRARAGRELVRREFDSQKNYGQLKACFERLI